MSDFHTIWQLRHHRRRLWNSFAKAKSARDEVKNLFAFIHRRLWSIWAFLLLLSHTKQHRNDAERKTRTVCGEKRRIKRMTNVKVQRNEKININKISQENSRVARTWRTADVSGRASVWTVRRNKRQITKLNENKTKRICEVRVDLTGRNPFCQNLELVGGKKVFESRPSFDRLNVFVKYANQSEAIISLSVFDGFMVQILERIFNPVHSMKKHSRDLCAQISHHSQASRPAMIAIIFVKVENRFNPSLELLDQRVHCSAIFMQFFRWSPIISLSIFVALNSPLPSNFQFQST